jgi:hypothetical protein
LQSARLGWGERHPRSLEELQWRLAQDLLVI